MAERAGEDAHMCHAIAAIVACADHRIGRAAKEKPQRRTRMTGHVIALLPVGAAAFAVPQFVPQLVRVRRLGASAGVSWTWAAMTCVNNAAWVAYFTLSHFYSALVPAAAAVVFAGLETVPRGPALAVTGWALGLAAAGVGYGRIGLGTALAGAFFLQVIPSVWTAYRTRHLVGVSVATWLLIFGELA